MHEKQIEELLKQRAKIIKKYFGIKGLIVFYKDKIEILPVDSHHMYLMVDFLDRFDIKSNFFNSFKIALDNEIGSFRITKDEFIIYIPRNINSEKKQSILLYTKILLKAYDLSGVLTLDENGEYEEKAIYNLIDLEKFLNEKEKGITKQ